MGKVTKALERRKGTMHHGHITPNARDKYATLPGGKYPMPDKAHARNALSRVAQAVKAGRISSKDASKVRNRALRMLGN